MGNNSNTQTLRLNLFYNTSSLNLKTCMHNIMFIKLLRRCFFKKQVFLVDYSVSVEFNKLEVTLFAFFRTRKLISYKKLTLKPKLKTNNLYYHKLFNVFKNKALQQFKFKVFVLNKVINLRYSNKKLLVKIYKKFQFFKLKLFNKNFNLFFDFIKLSLLFLVRKLSSAIILHVLSLIFCFLRKRVHSTFLFFLKTYFSFLLENQKFNLKGFKFLIFGKIAGKTRASFKRIQVGSVSIQSVRDNIQYSKSHVYTRYGVFGFKLWVSLI